MNPLSSKSGIWIFTLPNSKEIRSTEKEVGDSDSLVFESVNGFVHCSQMRVQFRLYQLLCSRQAHKRVRKRSVLACAFPLDCKWSPLYALPINWAHWGVKCHNWTGESQQLRELVSQASCDISLLCCILCTSEIGTAGKKSHPGPWPVPLHLQSANCHGDEEALLQCAYQEAVSGVCNQGSAMVTCVPPEGKSPGKVCFLHLPSLLLIRCKM